METVKALSVLVLALFLGCTHDPLPVIPDNTGGGSTGGGGGTSGTVCFETEVLPLFQSGCAKSGCHDAASREEGYQLDSYANIVKKGIKPGNPSGSKIYQSLFASGDDRMPRPPYPAFTDQQKSIIAKWIQEGAKNTTNCNTSCDTTNFKYATAIQPLLTNYCAGCHTGSSASGGIRLDSYAAVKTYADNGRLYGSIAHLSGYSAMPQGAAKLNDCQLRTVQKWIQAGAPNN
jgi:uncharacterized membrane protein